jgi:thiol-disulfide isomerase/thioredoxin
MKTWALVAVAVGAMAAGAALYLARQQQAAAPAPTAAPQASATDATPPAKAPVEVLPQFQLADRDGQLRSLADWPGKALIVNFWATWCAPCRREIPLLQQLQRDHGDEGFQVIGIAVDFRDKVLAYATDMKIDYPLLIGEQDALDAAAAFGVPTVGFPFTVFSDRRGRVVTTHFGELTAPEADLILDAVDRVDAGEVTPEQARAALETALAALPPPPEEE